MRNAAMEPSEHGGSAADRPGRSGLVAAELVRAQYRNIPTAVAVNLVISALLCLALRETVSPSRLGAWLCAIYLVASARFLFWRRFNATFLISANASQWRRIAFLGSGVNGFVWGLGGIVLYAP